MTTYFSTWSLTKTARITGVLYLLIILCGLYSGMMVRASLIDMTDAVQTLKNIKSNILLCKTGFLCDMAMVICDVMVSILFYFLLRSVHQGIAIIAAVFRLMQSAILGVNLLHAFTPVLLIEQAGHGSAAFSDQLADAVLGSMIAFEYGYLISGVFFAINCALMGYLLYHSGFIPKILGVMIGLASVGYLSNCMAHFIVPKWIPASEMVMLCTAVVAELSLCLYLLIRGVRRSYSTASVSA